MINKQHTFRNSNGKKFVFEKPSHSKITDIECMIARKMMGIDFLYANYGNLHKRIILDVYMLECIVEAPEEHLDDNGGFDIDSFDTESKEFKELREEAEKIFLPKAEAKRGNESVPEPTGEGEMANTSEVSASTTRKQHREPDSGATDVDRNADAN